MRRAATSSVFDIATAAGSGGRAPVEKTTTRTCVPLGMHLERSPGEIAGMREAGWSSAVALEVSRLARPWSSEASVEALAQSPPVPLTRPAISNPEALPRRGSEYIPQPHELPRARVEANREPDVGERLRA